MSDFARKAVHWTQEDVKAAAAVLRGYRWDLDKSLISLEASRKVGMWLTEEKRLRDLLDNDFEAMKSLLIFVNEFRCLIEGADSPTEGTSNVDAVEEAV